MQVSDAAGKQSSKTLALVCVAVLTINNLTLPAGTVGLDYSAALSLTGGTPPYVWSVVSGQLPPGTTMDSAGAISGTPTTVGTYNSTIQAVNAQGYGTSKGFSVSVSNPVSGSLDQYGGNPALPCTGGQRAHFYTEKINSRWWLCTPDGNTFFENNAFNIAANNGDAHTPGPQGKSYNTVVQSKYGNANDYSAWAEAQIARLKAWGFNTIGEYSDWYVWERNVPWSVMLNVMRDALKNSSGYVKSAPSNC